MKDFNDFIRLLGNLDSVMIDISSNVKGKKLSELGTIKVALLDLIKRIHANLHVIKMILPEFIEVKTLAVPISLLVRTCLSDALTGFYLLTFSKDEVSFQNELNLMALDYISYLAKLTQIEPHFSMPDLSPQEREKIVIEKLDEIALNYPDLIESRVNLKIIKKTPAEIRSSSNVKMFPFKEIMNLPLTDLSKFERLFDYPDEGMQSISYLYPLYRFYSQFHHYSVLTRKLMDLDIQVHKRHLTLSIFLLYQSLYSFCTAVEVPEELLIPIQQNIEEIYKTQKIDFDVS